MPAIDGCPCVIDHAYAPATHLLAQCIRQQSRFVRDDRSAREREDDRRNLGLVKSETKHGGGALFLFDGIVLITCAKFYTFLL
jgi:hypothetical protein